MANGLDELVDWLVGEVAFSGERGKSVDELLTAVSIFYAESKTPENPRVLDAAVQGRDHDGNGCTSEKCDGGHSIRTNDAVENKIDIQLARSVWGWLRRRSEIVVGRDGSKNHLSLDDALALPEVNLSEAKLHEPLVADDNEVGHIAEGSTETAKTADGAPRLARKKRLRLAAAPIKDSDGPTTRPRLYATEQTIWYALTGHDVDFKKIPPLEWKCLMGIASAKKSGILQADLRALVNQDKRSVPKRTDFLARKGYAVKRTIIANGFRTSILWLTTFAPPKIAHTDTLEAAIPQAGIEAAAATSAKASPMASQSEEFVAGGINLSTAYLTKDLEPVSWRSRWMGKSIEFASFGQTILAIVKAWGVIRLVDLKKKLGVQGRPWQMRTLARVCREFVASGVLKFVAAVRQVNRRLFKDCIKFERDPTKSEWAMYLAAGRKRMPLTELRSKQKKEQQLSQRNQRQKQKQAQKHGELQNIDGEGRAAIELAEFSGESSDDSGVDDGHTATAAVATLPFWVPERPLVNLVFDIVQQAGARGITSPEICKASVGPSFGRYIFSLVTDMASFGSQPHNLGRFQLASAATRNNKNNAYVFKAAITVASRNATDISGRSRPLSRTILPRLSHIFGFSTLVDLAVNLSQQSSLSVLAHGMIIMDNFRWRKNGRRKYGQQTEREKAFETDIEAYLSAPTTETQSGEKNIDRIDAIMLEDESDSGNGGGVAFSLQKQKPAPATGLIREPEKLMNQSVNERPSVPPEIPELQVARDPSVEHDGDDEEQPRDISTETTSKTMVVVRESKSFDKQRRTTGYPRRSLVLHFYLRKSKDCGLLGNNMGHMRENYLEYSLQQGAESNNVMGQGFDDILPSSAERSEVENQRKAHALSNKVGAIFTRYNGSPGYLTIDRKRRIVNFISESTAARESILSIPIDNITNDPSICDAPDGYGQALIFEATGAEKHPLAPSCVSPFVFLMDDKTKVNGQSALAFCNALMDFRLQRVARDKNEWQDNNGNENDNSQTEAMPLVKKWGHLRNKRKQNNGDSASRDFVCDKCGGRWKNSLGLQYHQTKARTPCNSNYEAALPTLRRDEKLKGGRTERYNAVKYVEETADAMEFVGNKACQHSSPYQWRSQGKQQQRIDTFRGRSAGPPSPRSKCRQKTITPAYAKSRNAGGFSECSETGNRANMPRGLVHFTVLSSASKLPAAQGNPGDSFETTVLGKGAARFTGLVGNRAKGFGVARLVRDTGAQKRIFQSDNTHRPASDIKRQKSLVFAETNQINTKSRLVSTSSMVREGSMAIALTDAGSVPPAHTSLTGAASTGLDEVSNSFHMPQARIQPKPTSVSLKSQRVAKIIKYLVDESGGVFPGERSLWYAVFGVYTNNFTGEDPPTLKICMSVVKRLEIIGEVEEHTFGFRNDKGLFVYCRLLARPGVDIFGSEAARMIKGRIQESHPYPYVPPNFTPTEEDMATLRVFDKNPSKTHNSRGRRNLAPKIEVLNAPFYELAAQERLSQIGRNASSFVEDDESEEFLGSARDTKDDATESEIYGVQNIKKRNVINDESDDTSNLAKRRNVQSFACAVGSVQTKFHGYAEEKAMGEWERGDIIASLEADDLDVQECEDDEEENVRFLSGTLGKQSLGSERLSSSLLLPGYERGREIQGGKATTRFPTFVQVLPRNTRGEGGIENEDDSDKQDARANSTSEIFMSKQEKVLQADLPRSTAEYGRLFDTDGRIAALDDTPSRNLHRAARAETSTIEEEDLPSLSEAHSWRRISKKQFTVETLPYMVLDGVAVESGKRPFLSRDERAVKILNEKGFVHDLRSHFHGVAHDLGRPHDGGGGKGKQQTLFPPSKYVFNPRREMTAYPEEAKDHPRKVKRVVYTAGDEAVEAEDEGDGEESEATTNKIRAPANEAIDWKADDTLLAMLVAVKSLLGGLNQAIDWGLILRFFPEKLLSEIRVFWDGVRRNRKVYVDNLTERFQQAFLDAYDKEEIPSLDFDDVLSYDWERLVGWVLQLMRCDIHLLPATRKQFGKMYARVGRPIRALGWREEYFHTARSVWNKLQDSTSEPAVLILDLHRTAPLIESSAQATARDNVPKMAEMGLWRIVARSWIRALCAMPHNRYKPSRIKRKLLSLGAGALNEVAINNLLQNVIFELQNERLLRKTKSMLALGGRMYVLAEAYAAILDKASQQEKFRQAWKFKAKLDLCFRQATTDATVMTAATETEGFDEGLNATAYELPLTVNDDGMVMALVNLQAHGRVIVETIDAPCVPFGFEPGNYETRKFPKHYQRFRQRVLPTSAYLFNDDAELEEQRQHLAASLSDGHDSLTTTPNENRVSSSSSHRPPIAGLQQEMPIWRDLFGVLDLPRFLKLVSAVVFSVATRGATEPKQTAAHLRPLLEPFEVQMLMEWAEATGILTADRHQRVDFVRQRGCTVSEWWWLLVGQMYADV